MSNPIPLETVKFSPLLVSKIMLTCFRYFFGQMPNESYRWDPDPKRSAIVIDTMNSVINKEDAIQKKPRILVSRGTYTIQKTSLTGDLVEEKSMEETKGLRDSKHLNFIGGGVTISIEAYEEGVCEMLADMVSTFLTWSSDHICNMYRFKQFGYPLSVGECQEDKEDREKYKILLSTGYLTESIWQLKSDSVLIKKAFMSLDPVVIQDPISTACPRIIDSNVNEFNNVVTIVFSSKIKQMAEVADITVISDGVEVPIQRVYTNYNILNILISPGNEVNPKNTQVSFDIGGCSGSFTVG